MKTPQKTDPRPPLSLSGAARKLWASIRDEYDIRDSGGLAVLTVACEAFDRMREAREVLAREGLVISNHRGELRAHPCTAIERDSRGQMLSAIRQLGLDLQPVHERVGRPAGLSKFRVV